MAKQQKCNCWRGWVCENHHNKPFDHGEGCGGAGDRCPNRTVTGVRRREPQVNSKTPIAAQGAWRPYLLFLSLILLARFALG